MAVYGTKTCLSCHHTLHNLHNLAVLLRFNHAVTLIIWLYLTYFANSILFNTRILNPAGTISPLLSRQYEYLITSMFILRLNNRIL